MPFKNIIAGILFLCSVSLYAQNRITVTLGEFNALSVSGGIRVELIPSETHDMNITSLQGKPEEVNYEISEGELRIKVMPKINKEDEISIQLPYRELFRIEAASGAVINSREDFKGKDVELKANTGGKIELSVEVKSIDARVNQVSDIVLYGTAKSQVINATTGGNYLAYDLECEDSYVKSTSGAQVKVTASRIIEATATSKGFIGYIGDPVSTYTKTQLGGEIAGYKSRKEADEF